MHRANLTDRALHAAARVAVGEIRAARDREDRASIERRRVRDDPVQLLGKRPNDHERDDPDGDSGDRECRTDRPRA